MRHNIAFLTGSVIKQPNVVTNEAGEDVMAIAFINVVRGFRSVGDHRKLIKADRPTIMTKEPELIAKMKEWREGDIVEVKGTIATQKIRKTSNCSFCSARNQVDGVLVYINPIYTRVVEHFDEQEECMKFLADNREVSNQVYVMGTLTRDPKLILPKAGLVVTQYQMAINRKFRIRTDPEDVSADYPWVKSYGENARDDRDHLHQGSEVYIDGCLQARSVQRHKVCDACGQTYDWKDRAMEIVPYATEYLKNFYDDEEIAKHIAERAEQSRRDILRQAKDPSQMADDEPSTIAPDVLTDKDREDGFTDEEA